MTSPSPAPEPRDLPPNWQELDAIESYDAGMQAIGERVRAGEPVRPFMLSRKAQP